MFSSFILSHQQSIDCIKKVQAMKPADGTIKLSYEALQPWDDVHGKTTLERMAKVSQEADQLIAQQTLLLPTVQVDPLRDILRAEHLQEVGRRVLVLKENAKRPDKLMRKLQAQQEPKRVIASRFGGDEEDTEAGLTEEQQESLLEGHIVRIEWRPACIKPYFLVSIC